MQAQNSNPDSLAAVRKAVSDSRNYVVRRKSDDKPNWFFGVFNSELVRRSLNGPFNVVAICDYRAASQVVFSVPYSFLKEKILPFAHIEHNGRYLFNINKATYEFNWSRNVKMDGNKFLAE